MTWIKDQDGDLWNSAGILWLFIHQVLNDANEIGYMIKMRTIHKDTYDFRGPFKTEIEAKETLDMLYVDMTVNHE